MKDPTAEHYAYDDDGVPGNRCDWDGKRWPCKTIRKWRASTPYRLKLLEDQVERLGLSNAALRTEGDRLRTAYRELDLIVNGGVVMALQDLMNGRKGRLTVSRTVDDVNVEDWGAFRVSIPGRTEFTVRYEAYDGSVWENKRFIERNTPTWP